MNKLLLINNTVTCFDTEDQTLTHVGKSCYPNIDYYYLMKVSGTIVTTTGTIDVKEGELVIKFYDKEDSILVLPEDNPLTKRIKQQELECELHDSKEPSKTTCTPKETTEDEAV